MRGGRAAEGCGETGEERRGGREGVEKKEETERGRERESKIRNRTNVCERELQQTL